MNFAEKKVLVLGLAKSGLASARALTRVGAKVTVNDFKKAEDLKDDLELLAELPVAVVTGGHPASLLDAGFDLIVKNPGIPFDIPFLLEAEKKGIPIISEPELAFQLNPVDMLAITGSNGKTTTTAWVGTIMARARENVKVAGNIGLPLSTEIEGLGKKDLVVVEMSSFQLNNIVDFRARVAALLNISPSHLDWHHSLEHYINAKVNIFRNQDEDDYAVLNADDQEVMALVPRIKSRILYFSSKTRPNQGAYLKGDKIRIKAEDLDEELLDVAELGVGYAHNIMNAMAAALISWAGGADLDAIRFGLKDFKGVKHRFQKVREKDGILYINDSKATNSQAALTALSLPKEPIIWMAGGLDRGQDLKELLTLAKKNCKAAVFLGEIKERMYAEALNLGFSNVDKAEDMADALIKARSKGARGDLILLSPACASWDMYESFEHRGDDFIRLIEEL